MTDPARVAIITRTKDRPIFLKRALDSVQAQTYLDYMHVIVNDGGDSRAVEELVAHLPASQRAKTKVFHRPVSSGAPDTIFNESIDRVGSEYFAIHDDDDTWHQDFLKETVAYLDKNPDDAAVVVRTDKVVEEVDARAIKQKKKSQWLPDVHVIGLYRQCIDNQFTPIATLFRRDCYEAVGKFDSSLPVVGDWEFGVRLLMKFDAAFIDPGYSLANYHHRVQKGTHGKDGSFANHNHRYYFNKVANQYLRKEMESGSFGPGYIMSKIKYEQRYMAKVIGGILPSKVTRFLKDRARS